MSVFLFWIKDNGVNLAETIDDFDKDPTGKSKGLPLHKGSHKKWDRATEKNIKKHKDLLINKYGKLEVPPISVEELKLTTELIEIDLKKEILKLPKGVKLK